MCVAMLPFQSCNPHPPHIPALCINQSTNAVLKRVPVSEGSQYGHADSDGMVWIAEDTRPLHERTGPASTTFHEGNGGEFRKVCLLRVLLDLFGV